MGQGPVSSPAATQACGNTTTGLHRWAKGLCYDYCSACGVVDAGPGPSRSGKRGCPHVWVAGTFRRICKHCGKIDRSSILAPKRTPAPKDRSQQWRGKVRMCWARDGEGCFYCRLPLAIEEARLDHFIPRSKGGPDCLENRRVACKQCDVRKRDRWPWEFMPLRFDPDPAWLPPPELADGKSVDEDSAVA